MFDTVPRNLTVLLLCLLVVAACAPAQSEEGLTHPTSEQALEAPPAHLALGYLATRSTLDMIEFARAGGTVQTPEVTINASNAETYAARYTERLATYTAAIDQRGYQRVAGVYSVRASDACGAAGSMLPAATGITINQDRFKVELTQDLPTGDRLADIVHKGIIVENTLVITDAIASDFTFLGQAQQRALELRPYVANIQATYSGYPADFPPRPDWDALSRCIIRLTAK